MIKGAVIGFSLILLGVFGLVLELVLLGGNPPRIESSINTRAYIGIAFCIVAIVGVLTILVSVWMDGRRGQNARPVDRERLRRLHEYQVRHPHPGPRTTYDELFEEELKDRRSKEQED